MSEGSTKILVVDDDFFVTEMLKDLLENGGYLVEACENGQEAFDYLLSVRDFDLVIADMNMPVMNGLELINSLRKEGSDIPIIILTGNNEIRVAIDAMNSGANDYLLKDENIQETLFLSVERVLEKNRLKIDLVEKNRELKNSNEELRELNRLKNKFLGIAAHDLRTPISGIKGIAELFIDQSLGSINEEQLEFIEMIFQTSNEMLSLLNNLLDISMIEMGKLDINPTKGSLKKLIENRIKMNRVAAEKKNIEIKTQLSDVNNALFDSGRITQVFENLMSNAIKFSPPGLFIFVELKQVNEMAYIEIKDEGPGISDEDQRKLFNEFQSLSAKPTGKEKSTGLGLAIAKKIIEAHGGSLIVESKVGEGSSFTFTVPLDKQS